MHQGGASKLEVDELSRADLDNADDFAGFTEAAGSVEDLAGNLYDPSLQVFSRSVTATYGSETITDLAASISGLTVTITIQDTGGAQWQLTRFVPAP